MSLSPKDPAEKVNVTFDFSNNTTGTVTNPVITVCLKGTNTDLPGMKATGGVVSTNKVTFMLQGGDSGKQYDLRCEVDLPSGEHIAAKDVITIKTL